MRCAGKVYLHGGGIVMISGGALNTRAEITTVSIQGKRDEKMARIWN